MGRKTASCKASRLRVAFSTRLVTRNYTMKCMHWTDLNRIINVKHEEDGSRVIQRGREVDEKNWYTIREAIKGALYWKEFFLIGGQGLESFFSAFSDEVLQAAFNSRQEELESIQGQSKGEIWQASEEQIQGLSKTCSRGGRGGGGSGSSEEEIKPRSLPSQKPRYSNNHGKMHMITGNECRHLRNLDMEVGIVNITRGSMMAPKYTTRATKIAVVVEGSGYFEMACPHMSGSGGSERRERSEHGREEEGQGQQKKSRGYKQVRAQIKEGSVIVLPAGHPATFVAGNEGNLAVICFGVGASNDEEVFLTGGNSVLKQLDGPAKALVFSEQGRQAADRVIGAQTGSVFLRGPQQQRRGGDVSDM